MRLIDLDNDILIEPRKKIIQSSSEIYTGSNSKILMPSDISIKDEVTRRKFLLYASGILAGTIIPTKAHAVVPFALIGEGLALLAINIIRHLIAETIKKAVKEIAKKKVKTIFGLSRAGQDYVIDAVVDLLSDYLGNKINRAFIKNALLKHDILNTPIEAGWDIDRKNKLEVSFYNPTDSKITTTLKMYIYDVNNKDYDYDTPTYRYVKNYYLEVMPGKEVTSYELFAELPKTGMKNIIFIGNQSFKNLKIKKSNNIIVDTIIA